MAKFHFSPRENKAHLIKWRKWGEAVFQEAEEQDKLILLSISAAWCHWCHVMDEESYSNDENINLINERFIPVRVDNDRQPDVNRRYNMGGWPTTAVLTPEGELLQGGMYIPADGLQRFLKEIDQIYHENPEDIKHKVKEFYERRHREETQIEEKDLQEEMILNVQTIILECYDDKYGGFGNQPKFPHFEAIDFLLDEYHRTKDDLLKEVLYKTLSNMAGRSMYDREMGGFFRYSTTRDWSIPHFEKMLEDNVKFINIYLKAFQIFNDGIFKDVALDVIMYLQDWLIDQKHGLFYGSQDADEEYYEMTRAEREKVKPPYIDQAIYTSWNGLAFSAFFRAFLVLDAVDCRDLALRGIEFLMNHCFNPKEGMYHYYLDGRTYNTGLLEDQLAMINALLDAFEVTHLRRYVEQAEQLANLTIERFYDYEVGGFYIDRPESKVMQRMSSQEKPLPTNSCMAELFLRLEVITGGQKYRDIAIQTLRRFADQYQEYSLFSAAFGRAVSAALHGFTHITIVGNFDASDVRKLFQESMKAYSPHKVVEELDPILDQKRIENLGYNLKGHQAYICRGKTCYPPVKDAEEISKLLITMR